MTLLFLDKDNQFERLLFIQLISFRLLKGDTVNYTSPSYQIISLVYFSIKQSKQTISITPQIYKFHLLINKFHSQLHLHPQLHTKNHISHYFFHLYFPLFLVQWPQPHKTPISPTLQQKMQSGKPKGNMVLSLKSITWYKDSHSLFDYQSNKISSHSFTFPVTSKSVTLYRNREKSSVIALEQTQIPTFDREEYQFLTRFQIKPVHSNRFRLNFSNDTEGRLKKINSERLNTDQSNSVSLREEETYLIVRKQKDVNGEPKGIRLEPAQTIKLGRVQFYVSEVCVGGKISTIPGRDRKTRPTLRFSSAQQNQREKHACKICLEEDQEPENFLLNPCKCSGSCGTVHIDCLLQWISIKVKKEVVGGTLHYNFQKFQCEICKAELPVAIETDDGKTIEMLPIEKPKDNYVILEGACEKSKSVMMIQNVPQAGIKLGRGHECQIRITDISVSRNHAYIKFNGTGFHIFDNKSKFGTLVKPDNMNMQVGNKQQQGIQIGRTVVLLDIVRQGEIKQRKTQKEIQQIRHPVRKATDRR